MNYKIEIISKLEELKFVLDEINPMLSEYDDIEKVVKRANEILNGKLDNANYLIKQDQVEQCLNSINSLIDKFSKRKAFHN